MSGKFALLLGNDQYQDSSFGALTVPRNDVEALQKVLQNPETGGFDTVDILLNGSLEAIMAAIGDLFEGKTKNDLVVLYFSGHGALDGAGQLYLALNKTRHAKLSSTAIWASFIKNEMNSSRSRRQVLILDCCHSGAFGRDAVGAKDALSEQAIDASTFEVKGYGREVLVSSSATQRSWEGNTVIGDTDKSLFTHYLVEGISSGRAAAQGDTEITVGQLYDYVHREVVKAHPGMTPQRFVDHQQGAIVLARNPNPVIKPKPLPEKLTAALARSEPFIREGAVKELGRLMAGKDKALAQSAKLALESQRDEERDIHVLKAVDEVISAYTETSAKSEEKRVREKWDDVSKTQTEKKEPRHWFVIAAMVLLMIGVVVVVSNWLPIDRGGRVKDTTLPPVVATPDQKSTSPSMAGIDSKQPLKVFEASTPSSAEVLAQKKIAALLRECEGHFKANRLTKGRGGTALDCYEAVLQRDSGNARALDGLEQIEARYVDWITSAFEKKELGGAKGYLEAIKRVNPESPRLLVLQEKLDKISVSLTEGLKPGDIFRDTLKDGFKGPEMVVIPSGKFRMGDVQGGGDSDEKPVREVRISKPFALSRYEITFDEYSHFTQATGRNILDDEGWGRGNRPVINVSWADAVAYADWVSTQTSKSYRLPTEAEWEYAARGGTKTAYWWGKDIDTKHANCDGCGSQWDNKKTAPVGSFKANSFGLQDTSGNAWEWVQDCWHDNYKGAPKDGSAWVEKDCVRRVIRGGAWSDIPGSVRSAYRYRAGPGYSDDDVGFRLAQDL